MSKLKCHIVMFWIIFPPKYDSSLMFPCIQRWSFSAINSSEFPVWIWSVLLQCPAACSVIQVDLSRGPDSALLDFGCSVTLSNAITSHWLLSSNSLAMWVWPLSEANMRAVVPCLSCTLASASQLSNSRTITTWPCLTAKCKAVWPVCGNRDNEKDSTSFFSNAS